MSLLVEWSDLDWVERILYSALILCGVFTVAVLLAGLYELAYLPLTQGRCVADDPPTAISIHHREQSTTVIGGKTPSVIVNPEENYFILAGHRTRSGEPCGYRVDVTRDEYEDAKRKRSQVESY